MSDPPLDLRSLALVDSPDVVKAALRTFRRRILFRSLWGLLAGAVAVTIVYTLVQPHELPDRIRSADITAHPASAVWEFGKQRIALADIVRLDDRLGLRFVVVGHPSSPLGARTTLAPEGMLQPDERGSVDHWFEIERPQDGTIRVEAYRAGRCSKVNPCGGSFVIELSSLGIPDEVWR